MYIIWLTIPFYLSNDPFVFQTCEYLMFQTYIYIVLSFLSLFQEMSMPLTSWRHWDSRLQNTKKLFEEIGTSHLCTFWFLKGEKMCIWSHGSQWTCSSQVWRQTIRSGQEWIIFKDLIKGCTTHVDYGSYFPGSKLYRFYLHLDLSTVTLYPNRSTPNTWLTPNACSNSGQISVSQLLLPPTPLPKLIWKDRHTHKLTLRKKWAADHSQSSNLVIQKRTKWGNLWIYRFRLQ
jgi:hypothetical protein